MISLLREHQLCTKIRRSRPDRPSLSPVGAEGTLRYSQVTVLETFGTVSFFEVAGGTVGVQHAQILHVLWICRHNHDHTSGNKEYLQNAQFGLNTREFILYDTPWPMSSKLHTPRRVRTARNGLVTALGLMPTSVYNHHQKRERCGFGLEGEKLLA